jgi:hypothetical protein
MEASARSRQVGSQTEANLIGQVEAGSDRPVCQQGLNLRWDGGEAEATLREGGVQLLVHETLRATPPQKVPNDPVEASRC